MKAMKLRVPEPVALEPWMENVLNEGLGQMFNGWSKSVIRGGRLGSGAFQGIWATGRPTRTDAHMLSVQVLARIQEELGGAWLGLLWAGAVDRSDVCRACRMTPTQQAIWVDCASVELSLWAKAGARRAGGAYTGRDATERYKPGAQAWEALSPAEKGRIHQARAAALDDIVAERQGRLPTLVERVMADPQAATTWERIYVARVMWNYEIRRSWFGAGAVDADAPEGESARQWASRAAGPK